MKNALQKTKYIYFLFFTLLISLTFSSCNDNKAYTKEISTADSLFTNQKFKEAKIHYAKALELNKGEVYPTEQITKIDELISKKLDFNYQNKLQEADAFFENKEFDKAKRAYVDASNLKPNEGYPKAKINEIEKLTTAKPIVVTSKAYHVVAGSYAIEANALALQKGFSDNGRKSTVEKSRNGNFLVSLNSFTTITEAYNYLITLEDDFDTSIWVYKLN
mgnify:CR=1 FL=1